ncbi:MAG: alpha/beta hydrolase, partial [Planctomycetaceae bacterium]
MQDASWLDRKAYPFAPHAFTVDGGQMHYVDEGSGRPVVMVHGLPTWSFLYRHLISALAPGFRC